MVAAPELTLVGLHASADTRVGATRLNVAVWEDPLRVAVTAAVWVVVMVPRLAANVVDVLVAGTVTDAGTVSAVLLIESPIALPPLGAGWVRVTVQVVAAPALTLVGLQARPDTRVGATMLRAVVCKEPFKVALTEAVWVVVNVPAVAMKVAEVAPAGTLTAAGTESTALLSDSVTGVLAEAARFRFSVQVVEAPDDKEPGLQLKVVKVSGKTVTVPPVAVV